MTTSYQIRTKVVKVTNKKETVAVSSDGTQTINDLGWFILLEGSHEYLYLGKEEPEFKVGQEVTIRIE